MGSPTAVVESHAASQVAIRTGAARFSARFTSQVSSAPGSRKSAVTNRPCSRWAAGSFIVATCFSDSHGDRLRKATPIANVDHTLRTPRFAPATHTLPEPQDLRSSHPPSTASSRRCIRQPRQYVVPTGVQNFVGQCRIIRAGPRQHHRAHCLRNQRDPPRPAALGGCRIDVALTT